MRTAQIAVFGLSVIAFVASAFFIGEDTGDTLWRLGVAAILVDLAFVKLWPSAKA